MNPNFWQGRRVFLTGHTGFKGSWLSLWLQHLGTELTGFALAPPTTPSLFEVGHVGKGMRSIIADVRDLLALQKAMREAKPEIVIHMAAQPLVRYSYQEPVETYAINVMGTVHLLEAVRQTDTVRALVNVIGGGDWAPDRLIPDILRAIEARQPVQIRNPHAIRPWQHVLEPLSGYLTLAEKLCTEGPAYAEGWNFGPPDTDARPVQWIVEQLTALWGEGASWQLDANTHPHEAHYLKLDCSKARASLDWQPRWDLPTTLAGIVRWHKQMLLGDNMQTVSLRQIADYQSQAHP